MIFLIDGHRFKSLSNNHTTYTVKGVAVSRIKRGSTHQQPSIYTESTDFVLETFFWCKSNLHFQAKKKKKTIEGICVWIRSHLCGNHLHCSDHSEV